MNTAPIAHDIRQPHPKVPVRFQILCTALSLMWFSFIIKERLKVFNPLEKYAEITEITPPLYQQFGGNASFVNTGLYIERFVTFDMVENSFVFVGYVWFKFTPGTLSLENLEKFIFLQGEFVERSTPTTQLIDNQLLATFHVKLRLSSVLHYQEFPFDDHRLRITMFHNALSPDEIVFHSGEEDLIINSNQLGFGWKELNQAVEPGYIASTMDVFDKRNIQYHPAVTFSIDYKRYGVRLILIILLPILLMLYIAIFGFSLDENTAVRNAIGSLTGILGYRFVIDRLSPTVGYFMISDYIFFVIVGCASLTLIIHLIALYQITLGLRLKQLIVLMLHLLVGGLSAYFFFM